MDEIERAKAIVLCHDYLLERDIEVHIVHNLETVPDLVDRSSKPYLTPLSSPKHNDISQANVLWLTGLKNGEPVMLGGARLEVVGRGEIGSFWTRSFRRHYCSEIYDVHPQINERVHGKLAYFGDMYVDPHAGAGLIGARAFTSIGHLLTMNRWDQDWTYSLLHSKDAFRGAGLRYGFDWFKVRPYQWVGPAPETRSQREVFAAISKRDQPNMIRATIQDILDHNCNKTQNAP